MKEVDLPPEAETVTLYVPGATDPDATIFKVVEHVGLHVAAEKEKLTPTGKPLTEKVMLLVGPETKLAVTEFDTELLVKTDLSPPLDRE